MGLNMIEVQHLNPKDSQIHLFFIFPHDLLIFHLFFFMPNEIILFQILYKP
jgi:hypothetical protein